jgi:methylenetetrahydrofolate--tRNA-(uracil-5-)-methyltransferase
MTAAKPVPSNINFGLFPTPTLSKEQRKNRKLRKKIKKKIVAEQADRYFNDFISNLGVSF